MSDNKKALSESESKKILIKYNVPCVTETIVKDADAAVATAKKNGFPVVLKGLGEKLLHKTERGLVHLNLNDPSAVTKAAEHIIDEAGEDLEGILVQPQIEGKREFVAGLFRDKQFGPVVMFGLGGIFTEALSDVVFRLAPLSEKDVNDMIDSIKSKKLLGDFRGEKAANLEDLKKTLLGISKIGMENPDISEIDINPLIITPKGEVLAVDALIIKEPGLKHEGMPLNVKIKAIGSFFHPKSIAFVGASAELGKWGHTLLTNVIGGMYKGEIYLVNPKSKEIAGRKVYKTIEDIEGDVDIVVVTIPAAFVMDLIPQFERKGVKNMLLISSGFAEVGDEGRKLEEELIQKANDAGILLLGPNTMGICNPHIDLYCTGTHVRPKPGSTLLISQSGNMGNQLLAFAEQQDIGVRGFIGSGNEGMVTIEDLLSAAGEDRETKAIMLYLESVKKGRTFYEIAKEVGKRKPIVLLKGGESEIGNMAAASHTGAMTSNKETFNAMCSQAGIVKVKQSMDMLDLAATFSSVPLPKGKRVAVMTLGGGWGVITADLCDEHGLVVPELSDDLIKTIDGILPPYWSRSNPIDLVGENDTSLPVTVLKELAMWDGCDAIIHLGIMGKKHLASSLGKSVKHSDPSYDDDFLDQVTQMVSDFEKDYVKLVVDLMEQYNKPIIGVNLVTDKDDNTVFRVDGSDLKGVFFPTPERAVKVLSKMAEYSGYLDSVEN
jgi:acyl-CoA synthetase (NDP forming)